MQLTLNKLPWYAQVVAFVVVAILAVGGFYYFYVMPMQEDMAARQRRLDSLRGDINKALSTARRLPEFQAQIADLEARLEGLKPVLPEQKDVADLLRRIQTLATQSNLTIQAFKPQAIATKQLHAEWPISLQLVGTYHNLGFFFDKISKVSRIINVSEITIRAKDKPDESSTIAAECTATTFVLLETPPGAAPPAGQPTGTTGRAPTVEGVQVPAALLAPSMPAQAHAQAPKAPLESYTYNPEGRRDPFVSLLLRGSDLRPAGKRPDGVPGLLIGEITVRGVMRSRSSYVAMIQGPDNKTYVVHPGDRLFDGVVKAITVESVVFMQEVNDPLSLVKQREVRKPVRTIEEPK